MKTILSFITILSLLVACKKDHTISSEDDISAAYGGTFQRSGMQKSGVLLTLNAGTFTGSSSQDKYPAICRGSYTIDGSTITFIDSCNWTADFDWTLILNGTYNITMGNNRSLRIWRSTGSVTDEYLLDRLSR